MEIVWREDLPENVNGGYDRSMNAIHLNDTRSPEAIRSTLLHELQHAVQIIEGFARVGSPHDEAFISAAAAMGIDTTNKKALRDAYDRLFGEVEARDVQARSTLTAEELRERPPYVSQGIPESDFIVRREGEAGFAASQGPAVEIFDQAYDEISAARGLRITPIPLLRERFKALIESRGLHFSDVEFRAEMDRRVAAYEGVYAPHDRPSAVTDEEKAVLQVEQGRIEKYYFTRFPRPKASYAGERGRLPRNQKPGPAGLSVSGVREVLSKRFGGGAGRLVEAGTLRIIQSESGLPAHLNDGKGGIRGVYDPKTDTTWLVADNLSAADAPGVFLHELGVHYGLERMVGSDKYQDIIRQLKAMERLGNEAVRAARAAIPNHTPAAAVDDELVAYLVEKHPELPLVKRILAAIRAFLFRRGLIKNIRPEDVVALARAAARHAARGAVMNRSGSAGRLAPAYSGSPLWYSEMAKFIDAKAPGKSTAAQWKGLLEGWAKAGKFKGDELEWSGVNEWLDLQQGPVTKAQVLGFVRENGVRVEETMLGEVEYQRYTVEDTPQPGFDITPELRESAMRGLPLFSKLRDTAVAVPEGVFRWLGVAPGNVFADYDALYRKHPDQFSSPQEAQAHVEHVLAAPDFAMPATKEEYTLLVRRNGADKVTVVEFALRGGKYRVRAAYTFTPGQLERKWGEAVRRWGGTPRVLARTDESVSSSRPLTASRDTDQPDSRDETIGPGGSPVKGPQGPLYSRATPEGPAPRPLDPRGQRRGRESHRRGHAYQPSRLGCHQEQDVGRLAAGLARALYPPATCRHRPRYGAEARRLRSGRAGHGRRPEPVRRRGARGRGALRSLCEGSSQGSGHALRFDACGDLGRGRPDARLPPEHSQAGGLC